MAISRRVEKIINNGGHVKSDIQPSKRYKMLCQTVRLDILQHVDEAVAERPGISRNGWIQEAIQEKLKRIKDVHQN